VGEKAQSLASPNSKNLEQNQGKTDEQHGIKTASIFTEQAL
jgi:hypothetical protein